MLLSVMVNWHIAHLTPQQAAFHTKCIFSELRSFIRPAFHLYHICCRTTHSRTITSIKLQLTPRETQSILQEVTASHWMGRAAAYTRDTL